MDRQPVTHYQGDLKPEFGEGNPRELILRFFRQQLPVDIVGSTTLTKAEFHELNQGIRYVTRTVKFRPDNGLRRFGREVRSISVPARRTKFVFGDSIPDFLLMIDNLEIGTEYTHHGTPMMGAGGTMMMGAPSKYLCYVSDFVLWDNRAGMLISCGHVKKCAFHVLPVVTMDIWLQTSMNYVRGVFWKSPFWRM